MDDVLFLGDEQSSTWVNFLHQIHAAYQWSPWEVEDFQHCGVRLQQWEDGSIDLNHSEFCKDIAQMAARKKGDDSPLDDKEVTQARAIMGAIQWRVTQTAPQHASKLSLLQSSLSSRSPEIIENLNKLVREVHANKNVTTKVQRLSCAAEDMILVGWSDAALANRPDGGSTGGYLFGFMSPTAVARGEGRVNPLAWRCSKLARVARSSLAAEAQALADLEQEVMFTRLEWRELLGDQIDLASPASTTKKVRTILLIDAKALYDTMEKGEIASSGYSMRDKYTALELQALSQHLREQDTTLLWTDSDRQLADGLTKPQKQDCLRKFLMTGTWLLRHDGAFISAKKRKSMGLETGTR